MENKMRKWIKAENEASKSLKFLYGSVFGRTILKVLILPEISRAVGKLLDTALSTVLINNFVKRNNINISDYEQKKYSSYNDFFTRKIAIGRREIDQHDTHLISPCDGKLTVYKINSNSTFRIKGSIYSLSNLLHDKALAEEFSGGICLIYRLTVDDYHRYCYFDSGTKGENRFISGKLNTVQPIAMEKVNVYSENCREYTILETRNFGRAIQIEVGALMVGKISNFHGVYMFSRGEEKGCFEFGGSTIVVLLKKDSASIDDDILSNSGAYKETIVKYGECIGKAKNI